MNPCASCGQEVPVGAAFCPSCGATTGAAPASPGASSAADTASASTFLSFGAVGAFTMLVVVLLSLFQILAKGMGEGVLIAQAVLGLAGLIALGVGFLGWDRATKQGLAKAVAIIVFVAAAFALLPLLARAARSRDLFRFALIGAPAVGAILWATAGSLLLGAKDRLGALATAAGVTLIASAVWDLVGMLLTLGRVIRGRSAAEVVFAITIVFLIVRLAGLGCLGAAFLKVKGRPAGTA